MKPEILYYAILLVVDSLLLFLTMYESQHTSWSPLNSRKSYLTIAGNCIAAAMPVTMIAGGLHYELNLAKLNAITEPMLMVTPMLMIFLWLIFYRKGSELLQDEKMDNNFIVPFYKEKVWETIKRDYGRRYNWRESRDKPQVMYVYDIYESLCKLDFFLDVIQSKCQAYSFLPISISKEDFKSAFGPFLLDLATLEKVLTQLEKEKMIINRRGSLFEINIDKLKREDRLKD